MEHAREVTSLCDRDGCPSMSQLEQTGKITSPLSARVARARVRRAVDDVRAIAILHGDGGGVAAKGGKQSEV